MSDKKRPGKVFGRGKRAADPTQPCRIRALGISNVLMWLPESAWNRCMKLNRTTRLIQPFYSLRPEIDWIQADFVDGTPLLSCPNRLGITGWTLLTALSRWRHGFEPRWDCQEGAGWRQVFGGPGIARRVLSMECPYLI